LIAAGVERVVCATVDPNPRVAGAGIRRLEAAGIAVTMAPFETEARRLNPGFFSRFERTRPFVRLKMAMSLDARTAAADAAAADAAAEPAPHGDLGTRAERWITDAASRADVQTLRARSSAVLTGAGTILADDPRLDVRLAYGDWVRQPLRVVLDSDRRCPSDANVFKDEHALRCVAEDAEGPADGVRTLRLPRARHGLDLDAAMQRLAEIEVNELFVECGPRLAGSFLEADLVDELILYVAPHLLGCDAPPLAAILGANRAVPLPRFAFQDHRLIEQDLRLVLSRKTHG
jgi:diaminohydroxyphosphoribosylaminopyrimidine deaminase/5-amino-6-(5-phosphoribosylamino)uracil reductase